ncbi:meiotic nuclear division protein 1 homolog [Neocloeon triangulifer]|uniref:meiotic nuclear division protein 1 homolog n=1 Tax=Neocloeon triangulifer TaxID=2078957 RepID=UPI00286F6681|nr:meiotic nuclear division protein 1 homolog [Neocloeon triangulifer]
MSRVTLEEKRVRMLEIFHESLDVFELKQLETIAPKQKGIVASSVKTVLQVLVDDGLIETDKDGGLVYFWSFPSNVISNLQKRANQKEKRLAELKTKVESLKEKKRALSQSEEGAAARQSKLDTLKALRGKVAELEPEVQKLQENDPETCEIYKAAANRWADNVYATTSWLRDKFGLEQAAVKKQFGIPEELEYFE